MQHNLIAEVAQMPDAAISYARGVTFVRTPKEFDSLLETVRTNHKPEFSELTDALDRRFNQPHAVWMGVFSAATEMALKAEVGGTDLKPVNRQRLRLLWETLLQAQGV
jgi:hypothetical protein